MLFGYPVAEQQIVILNYFGIGGILWLWVLRFFSFVLLFVVVWVWKQAIVKVLDGHIALISAIIVIITPIFFVFGLVYPLICIKLLFFVIGIGLGLKNKIYFGMLAFLLIVFNWQILGNRAAIFSKLNMKDAQTEVTKRISSEDSLKESLNMPLWWRRISYNKYYFTYKQILAEALPFFDFESIFFQEINPFAQKSIVIFYWPEMYLFVLGLYYIYIFKNRKMFEFLFILIVIAWIDFVFSEGAAYKRLVLVVFPLSVVISLAFYNLILLVKKSNVLASLAFVFVSVFITFGFINSFLDLNSRIQYWLDNRPLAFEFWYSELSRLNLDNYSKIQVSSMIGDSKQYCFFYLGHICDDRKFVFENFDLTKDKSINSVYAGFAGEFVGSRFKNDIDGSWSNNSNFKLVSKQSLRDTIANQYGNDIGVAIVN